MPGKEDVRPVFTRPPRQGEETTKTGAYWCSTRIRPTLAIVVDVTYTSDCIGMNPAEMGTVNLERDRFSATARLL